MLNQSSDQAENLALRDLLELLAPKVIREILVPQGLKVLKAWLAPLEQRVQLALQEAKVHKETVEWLVLKGPRVLLELQGLKAPQEHKGLPERLDLSPIPSPSRTRTRCSKSTPSHAPIPTTTAHTPVSSPRDADKEHLDSLESLIDSAIADYEEHRIDPNGKKVESCSSESSESSSSSSESSGSSAEP